jgi:diguanylate cyclase (GGDEF)-like protein
VDYLLKNDPQSIDLLLDLVRRLGRNHALKVLVVDDSRTSRTQVAGMLAVHRHLVLEAAGGQEALDLLEANPDVALMLVDHRMPGMDGWELVQRVRRTRRREQLAIVGMAPPGSGAIAARLLKCGATDVLDKPPVAEVFYSRVTEALRALGRLRVVDELTTRDPLTGLHNRRFFLEAGEKLCANARRGNLAVGVAVIDLDGFQQLNDLWGHHAGDEMLRRVATVLGSRFRESDVAARLGGGKFVVLSSNMDPGHTARIYDDVRRSVETLEVRLGDKGVRATVSIGVCRGPTGRIDHLLARAEKMLGVAKAAGPNRVAFEEGGADGT